MQNNIISKAITKIVLNASKKHAVHIDAKKEANYETVIVKYTGLIKFIMIFGIIFFAAFGVWGLYLKSNLAAYIFFGFAIASFFITLYCFTFSVQYDGPVITVHSIFQNKEFLRNDIRELSLDGRGGIRARFTNGRLYVEELCIGRQDLYDYLQSAFNENIDTIRAERIAKLQSGFLCKASWGELLVFAIFFIVIASITVFLVPYELKAGTIKLFTILELAALQLFPIGWFLFSVYHWIKVIPQKRVLRCYRFLFVKTIPFDAVLNIQKQEKKYLISFKNKKGKIRKLNVPVLFSHIDDLADILSEEVF